MSNLGRRKFLLYGSAALGTSILLKACGGNQSQTPTASPSPAASPAPTSGETIKVGILHSLSGTMAISETSELMRKNWRSRKSMPPVVFLVNRSRQWWKMALPIGQLLPKKPPN